MDIMQDPVVVGGSGNTYDRKSIEKHFQHCHRDPLNNMELRRPQDRRLIPNNQLRSQIRTWAGTTDSTDKLLKLF